MFYLPFVNFVGFCSNPFGKRWVTPTAFGPAQEAVFDVPAGIGERMAVAERLWRLARHASVWITPRPFKIRPEGTTENYAKDAFHGIESTFPLGRKHSIGTLPDTGVSG